MGAAVGVGVTVGTAVGVGNGVAVGKGVAVGEGVGVGTGVAVGAVVAVGSGIGVGTGVLSAVGAARGWMPGDPGSPPAGAFAAAVPVPAGSVTAGGCKGTGVCNSTGADEVGLLGSPGGWPGVSSAEGEDGAPQAIKTAANRLTIAIPGNAHSLNINAPGAGNFAAICWTRIVSRSGIGVTRGVILDRERVQTIYCPRYLGEG